MPRIMPRHRVREPAKVAPFAGAAPSPARAGAATELMLGAAQERDDGQNQENDNSTFAIPAAPAAMPPSPRIAATMAIMKTTTA